MTTNDAKETIIIVDDDLTNLTVGMHSLSDKYSVLTAPSGKKLFVLLEKVKPALILLDIEMPEMDGFEVIKLLKKSEKTAHIEKGKRIRKQWRSLDIAGGHGKTRDIGKR